MRTVITRVRTVKLTKTPTTKIVITTELMGNMLSFNPYIKPVRYGRKVTISEKVYWMSNIASDSFTSCDDEARSESSTETTECDISYPDYDAPILHFKQEDDYTISVCSQNAAPLDEVDLLCHEIPEETIEWAASVMQ